MARVLVTGGAGYVGAHTCKVLASNGHEPVVFDNLSRGHKDFVRWGPFVFGDVLDASALDRIFEQVQPDCVMHFAAYAYVGESMSDPGAYYRNNVMGTMSLLEVMRRHGVARIVFSSTCAIYGHPEAVPLTEDHPQRPANPYGASKAMVERILADYGAAYGISSVSLRYFNAAGADPDGDIGEAHSPETHAIPLILMAARGDIPQFDIYGTDYPTRDGTAIRDYIHVSDLADGHVRALDYLLGGGESQAINLGTGTGTSVLSLLKIAERLTGRAVPYRQMPRRPGDPVRLVADAAKAQAVLGWRPTFTKVEDIVETALEYFEANFVREAVQLDLGRL